MASVEYSLAIEVDRDFEDVVAATRELVMGDVGWVTLGHVVVLSAFAAVLFWVPVRRLGRTLLA